MEENPYQSPMQQRSVAPAMAGWQRPWLTWIAFGWLVFLFLYLPFPNTSRSPAGAFLGFKAIATAISAIAVAILILVPRGWWKAATIPSAGLLVFVQAAAWMSLP